MVFFDMDGTLAKFYNDNNYLERMYEKDYFLRLKPYKLIKAVKKLIERGVEVAVISACIKSDFCEQEKATWLKTYLPEIPESNYIFVETGDNKATAAQGWLNKHEHSYDRAILIDDYSENLYDWDTWAHEFIAIKFCNGINNKTKKQYRYKFKTNRQLFSILKNIGEIEDTQNICDLV